MPRSFSNPNLAAANKRDVYEPPVEPVPPRSTDRWRPTGVGESTRSRALPGNPDDEFGRTASSYHPVSPTNHYRPSMPNVDTNDRRPSFSGNRNDVPTFDRPPPPIDAYQNGGSSARPRRDSAYKQDDRPRGSRFDPEPAQQSPSSPVDSEPRIWMTREQSRAVFQVDHPQRPPPSSRTSNSRPPRADPTSWQPPFDESNLPSRRFNDGAPPPGRHDIPPRPPVDESPRMRRQDFSSDRGSERSSPIETRPRPLEGRLGSHYDEQYRYPPMEGPSQPSLPSRPRDRDIYPEPPPRADLKDVRDRPPPFRDEPPPTWDRSGAGRDDFKEPLPKAAVKTHPDRARLIGPAPDLPPTEDVLTNMRTSKPVRIRRPPPMPKTQQQQQQDNLATQMSMGSQELPPKPQGMREDERVSPAGAADLPFGQGAARPPNARHGGSLLDRLSLDDSHTEAPSPSLRDRVEGKGDAQLDAMDMESEGNGDGNGDPSMRGGRAENGALSKRKGGGGALGSRIRWQVVV
ncbi:hypothetical protein B0H21DRAFT_709974 [Amylocystis lapponica]|nr:hypothetical protein B0H21DRAFT_709974 [Amylocystis lapponica]